MIYRIEKSLNRLKRAIVISLFFILVIDLFIFNTLKTYPEIFIRTEILGPKLIWGFIIVVITSMILLFLFQGELSAIIGKSSKKAFTLTTIRTKVIEKSERILKKFKRFFT